MVIVMMDFSSVNPNIEYIKYIPTKTGHTLKSTLKWLESIEFMELLYRRILRLVGSKKNEILVLG